MNPLRLLLLTALLLLSVGPTSAQPTCSSIIDPTADYAACDSVYNLSEYVFYGQVVHVERIPSPMKGYSNPWPKVTVQVEKLIKGQLGPQVELILDGRCYGNVGEKGKYLFTAEWSRDAEVTGLVSHKWSREFYEVAPDKLAKRFSEIGDILNGVPQPRLVGRVMEYGWDGGRSHEGMATHAVPGVDVVVEDAKGAQVVSRTDDEGRFQFDELAPGKYSVRPLMPKVGHIRSGGELLKEGKTNIEIGTQVCSQILHFDLDPVGKIVGRIERKHGNWQIHARLSLQRVEFNSKSFAVTPGSQVVSTSLLESNETIDHKQVNEANDDNDGDEDSDDNKSDEGSARDQWAEDNVTINGSEGSVVRFYFDRVPPGQYILLISNLDPEGGEPADVYYPFERDQEKAGLINVELNKTTELAVTFPSLAERRIFGRVIMPDGSTVDAKVRLNTGTSASFKVSADSPILYDDLTGTIQSTRNGRFEFRNWAGREVRLFAFYDGVKDGKPVRFFGRSQNLKLDRDFGPLTITLDRVEPK